MAQKTKNLRLWLPDIGTGNYATLLNQNFEAIDYYVTHIKQSNLTGGNIRENLTMKDGAKIELEPKAGTQKIALYNREESGHSILDIHAFDIVLDTNQISIVNMYDKVHRHSESINNIGTYGEISNINSTYFDNVKGSIDAIGTFNASGITSEGSYFDNIKEYYGIFDEHAPRSQIEALKTYYGTADSTDSSQLGKIHSNVQTNTDYIDKIGTSYITQTDSTPPESSNCLTKIQTDVRTLNEKIKQMGFKKGELTLPKGIGWWARIGTMGCGNILISDEILLNDKYNKLGSLPVSEMPKIPTGYSHKLCAAFEGTNWYYAVLESDGGIYRKTQHNDAGLNWTWNSFSTTFVYDATNLMGV